MDTPLNDDRPASAVALTDAAKTRARAVYYGFAMLSVGFLVVLAFTM